MPEFIYVMRAVRKAHGDKVILDEVTLAFLPGAKIGVVGPNGMGKSTLLRMMAGVEQPSNGDARLLPGFTVGLLAQEPELDETKTVLGNVEDGVAGTMRLLAEYNEIAEKLATDYSDALLEKMGSLQEELDHKDAWDLDSQIEQAMDALRCPPPDADVTSLSGGERRRVALCLATAVPARPAAVRTGRSRPALHVPLVLQAVHRVRSGQGHRPEHQLKGRREDCPRQVQRCMISDEKTWRVGRESNESSRQRGGAPPTG